MRRDRRGATVGIENIGKKKVHFLPMEGQEAEEEKIKKKHQTSRKNMRRLGVERLS